MQLHRIDGDAVVAFATTNKGGSTGQTGSTNSVVAFVTGNSGAGNGAVKSKGVFTLTTTNSSRGSSSLKKDFISALTATNGCQGCSTSNCQGVITSVTANESTVENSEASATTKVDTIVAGAGLNVSSVGEDCSTKRDGVSTFATVGSAA